MKNIKYMYSKLTLLTALLFVVTMSCERDISDEAEFATLSKTGEIFTDSPIGLGSDFYFPYLGSINIVIDNLCSKIIKIRRQFFEIG